MKLTFIFILLGLMSFASVTYSQSARLTFESKNATIESVFKQIEALSEFKFAYNSTKLDVDKKISLKVENQTIDAILSKILGSANFQYKIVDRYIIITDENIGGNNLLEIQQQKSVSGKVTDSTGASLPGVSVVVKGTTTGVITDMDGKYSLPKVPENASLQFSFVGMKTQEIAVGTKTNINVTLTEDAIGIEEVVAIGYGTTKKVNLTGSVQTVSAKQIESRPTTGLLKSLQGTVAGVTIIDRPGGSPVIRVRGEGTFAGTGSEPLFILDGLEISGTFFNSLDPNMVENITVLKDASSAAIYGAKAAYGVILVTTKKGGSVKNNSITYSGGVGVQMPTYIPKVVDSWTYAEQYRIAELNTDPTRTSFKFSPDDIAKFKSGSNPDLYPNTNWFDLILQNSLYTRHNVQFVGGSEKASYLLSVGYQTNEDFYPGRKTDKYNFLAKAGFDVNSWMKVNSSVNLIISKYDRTTGNVDNRNLTSDPTITAKQSDGNWGSVQSMAEINPNRLQLNQLRQLNEGGRGNTTTRRLLGNINLVMNPFKGFKFTNMIGYNYYDNWNFDFVNSMNAVPSYLNPTKFIGGSPDNQMTQATAYEDKMIFDSWVNYDKKLGDHSLIFMAGFHSESRKYKDLSIRKKNFLSNGFNAINGGSNDPADIVMANTTGSFSEETQASYFARVGYNYREKYLFETNFRSDGSSRFANNKKWGFYPSVSAGWRIKEEGFIKDVAWIDNLKVRGSWGRSGNINSVGLYDTYDTYSVGSIFLGGETLPMLQESNIGNKDLTWESTTTTDIGLDFAFLGGKIDGTIDLFKRTTKDILVKQTDVFVETGIDQSKLPYKNVGSLYNKGFELSINHSNNIGQFQYSIGGNITYIKNVITDLGEGINNMPPSSGYSYTINMIGESINSYYLYKANGLYSPEDIAAGKVVKLGSTKIEPGMIRYVNIVDVPGGAANVITAADRVVCGDNMPDYTYGINFSASYKGFTLTAFGQGVIGSQVYLDLGMIEVFANGGTMREWQLDNWTLDNQDAVYPKLFLASDARQVYDVGKYSSYWLFDADYFRLKNLKLNYSIPSELLKKMKFKKIDIFVEGENLATIRADKRMKDFDPERGASSGNYYGMKTYSLGLNLTF